MKSDGYPLPWCEALDLPYWQINWAMRLLRPEWAEAQTGREMAQIIPEIDALIASAPK